MDGYYDYGPTVALERPVTLVSYVRDETRSIGYRVASLLGLPYYDIDRTIEHETGTSVWNLIWRDGEERYRELERRHVEKALSEKPRGLIALGDGALVDPETRRRVLAEADLVLLDLDLPNLYWRLKAGPNASMDFWHPLHAGPLERLEQVRPFYDARRPALEEAPHKVELLGRDRGAVVDRVVELVEGFAATA